VRDEPLCAVGCLIDVLSAIIVLVEAEPNLMIEGWSLREGGSV
jgi:hypothetical protein